MSGPGAQSRVSAIIPVYNGERFVGESIESALGQTVTVSECIVVDDGSTDGTMDVLRTFGADITVIRQAATGVAAARNAGMRAARGDLLAFLDADDVWLPHKTERQVAALASAGPHAACVSDYVMVNEDLRPRRLVAHRDVAHAVRAWLALEGPGMGFSFTGVVTRAAADRVGPFDERLTTGADLDYVRRLHATCRVVAVRGALALYRQHGPGQMHRDLDRLQDDMAVVLDAALADGLAASAAAQARANLETYVALRMLLQGEVAAALPRIAALVRRDPQRTVRLVASAAARRATQRARARPARLGPQDQSGPGWRGAQRCPAEYHEQQLVDSAAVQSSSESASRQAGSVG